MFVLFVIAIAFLSFHYADNFVIKVLFILSSIQWYLKYVYRLICLEATSDRPRPLPLKHLADLIEHHKKILCSDLVCVLLKHFAVIWEEPIWLVQDCWSVAIDLVGWTSCPQKVTSSNGHQHFFFGLTVTNLWSSKLFLNEICRNKQSKWTVKCLCFKWQHMFLLKKIWPWGDWKCRVHTRAIYSWQLRKGQEKTQQECMSFSGRWASGYKR